MWGWENGGWRDGRKGVGVGVSGVCGGGEVYQEVPTPSEEKGRRYGGRIVGRGNQEGSSEWEVK